MTPLHGRNKTSPLALHTNFLTSKKFFGRLSHYSTHTCINNFVSSKSAFVAAPSTRINLPPTGNTSLTKTPQPLTVMGYRPDLLSTQQKQSGNVTKLKSLNEKSSQIMKVSPTRTASMRYLCCILKFHLFTLCSGSKSKSVTFNYKG